MVTFQGVAHIAFTVGDMEAAAAWWGRVFGFERVMRIEEPPTVQRHPRILVRHPRSGVLLGLHEPYDRSGDMFDPSRTGLDHVALTVLDQEELSAWMDRLDLLGVEHSPVRTFGASRFISLEDPDGIQIELWSSGGAPGPDAA
ncbi:VOC family protein [Actinacidiphila rubida]|uniref:Catechol 2,3-dioxygenase n=1 Tax=Actinacidiphila rubida TaxID=310780 RepID=A0A1H8PY88_9ACTN|nr:VOC family protein [Actinacidiphila rubida]SEO46627.1 Catechol 2,3-dioxygenase [Actinacidiphila rubida]